MDPLTSSMRQLASGALDDSDRPIGSLWSTPTERPGSRTPNRSRTATTRTPFEITGSFCQRPGAEEHHAATVCASVSTALCARRRTPGWVWAPSSTRCRPRDCGAVTVRDRASLPCTVAPRCRSRQWLRNIAHDGPVAEFVDEIKALPRLHCGSQRVTADPDAGPDGPRPWPGCSRLSCRQCSVQPTGETVVDPHPAGDTSDAPASDGTTAAVLGPCSLSGLWPTAGPCQRDGLDRTSRAGPRRQQRGCRPAAAAVAASASIGEDLVERWRSGRMRRTRRGY